MNHTPRTPSRPIAAAIVAGVVLAFTACTQLVLPIPDSTLEPDQAGADFSVQGEYATIGAPVSAQVVALGKGRFRAKVLSGGLPGADPDSRPLMELLGAWRNNDVAFQGSGSALWSNGTLRVDLPDGENFTLPKVERTSPTLGAKPPPGAVIVFDGPGSSGVDGKVDERGLLSAGATSSLEFQDAHIHVEYRTPFEPNGEEQFRGNSGIYLQRRYEVQILDSFGQEPAIKGAGSLYGVRPPDVPMSFPPLSWQTYDIEFRAARFDASGKRTRPAQISVRHNGVVIHQGVELDGPTGRGEPEGPAPGPLYLQDHWHPVFFRNVWILPLARGEG